jgi:TonB family protein
MRRCCVVAILVFCGTAVLAPPLCFAQQDQPEATRKVVTRILPAYPSLARSMKLKGIVKVEALVATDGTVKSLQVKGGNPVLVQAAESAVRKWKWEPAAKDTREPVEVKFDPQ